MIGFVDNDAYNGVIGKNPFNFKHNNINFIALYKDGEQIPSRPLQPDFAGRRFIRSFLSLYTETGQYYLDEGIDLTKDDFKGGNALFAFDLTPDLGSCGEILNWLKTETYDWKFTLLKLYLLLLTQLCKLNLTTYSKSTSHATSFLTTTHELRSDRENFISRPPYQTSFQRCMSSRPITCLDILSERVRFEYRSELEKRTVT